MANARNGFVLMKLEKSPETPPVEQPRKSFDSHWSKKGWVEVKEDEATVDETADQTPADQTPPAPTAKSDLPAARKS